MLLLTMAEHTHTNTPTHSAATPPPPPRGWSSFTSQHHRLLPPSSSSSAIAPPPSSQFFPPLPLPPRNPPPPPPLPSSYLVALNKSLPQKAPQQEHDDPWMASASDAPPRSAGLRKLRMLHSWAESSLIEDVLEAVGLDEEAASAYLASIASESQWSGANSSPSAHASSSQSEDANSCSRISSLECSVLEARIEEFSCLRLESAELAQEACSGTGTGTEEESEGELLVKSQRELGKEGSYLSNLGSLPMEPEWEEDDVYHSYRRDALRMARVRHKHSHGAFKAFMMGDYSRANLLSKKAQAERVEADRLHVRAAQKIVTSRNAAEQGNLWKLDLHGLHVREAVAALQERLSALEARPSGNHGDLTEEIREGDNDIDDNSISSETPTSNNLHSRSERQPRATMEGGRSSLSNSCKPLIPSSSEVPLLHGRLAARLPCQRELKVVTGVGLHSRGGASLPRGVKNFLLKEGYKFNEIRPGVISVHPKFRLMQKDMQLS